MLHFDAEQRRQRHAQADVAEAVAIGYSSMKSKDGPRALEAFLHAARK